MINNFLIEIFLTITGVGAASGLHYENNTLFLISDNSNYLYTYRIPESKLDRYLLYEGKDNNEQVKKSEKLDIESVFKNNNEFYVFGSGSTKNRNHLFRFNPDRPSVVKHQKMAKKLDQIKKSIAIADEDFNIEGSFIYEDYFYLFNRGNGPGNRNGIILVDKWFKKPAQFFPISLPHYEQGIAGFTDAIRIDNIIYFLAAIEETKSTYEDGEKGGSLFGKMNLATREILELKMISKTHKFEGITLMETSDNDLVFLLCEDPDDNSLETTIYKLTIRR